MIIVSNNSSRQAIVIHILDYSRLAIVAEWNYLISIPNSEVKHSSAENTWTIGSGKIGHCQDFFESNSPLIIEWGFHFIGLLGFDARKI